ncbi:hypothetical protein UFOVP1290_136 [uncultured Caudovirales phage]|uniref:Uncharacterized protein n=1 Tax=uncultured Caudovirales phage TaxID=2100421 RepID=A0A6J5RQQ3_9CAUD|nr:hypothetical protein UFOVP1290_136 [uncultured Caudovirales phage]
MICPICYAQIIKKYDCFTCFNCRFNFSNETNYRNYSIYITINNIQYYLVASEISSYTRIYKTLGISNFSKIIDVPRFIEVNNYIDDYISLINRFLNMKAFL